MMLAKEHYRSVSVPLEIRKYGGRLSRSFVRPTAARLLPNDLRQLVRVVGPDADDLPAQRQLHATEAPEVVGPASERDVMHAPAVDDLATADLDSGDVGVAESLAKQRQRAKVAAKGLKWGWGVFVYGGVIAVYVVISSSTCSHDASRLINERTEIGFPVSWDAIILWWPSSR